MKNIFFPLVIATLLFASSCKVTFTSDLRSKIEAQKLDLKKIQYYNSKTIVLQRILTTSDTRVASGEVRLQNGLQVEEIKIKKNTPGICDSLMADAVRIRFEAEKGRYLIFQMGAYGEYQLKSDRFDPNSPSNQKNSQEVNQFMELNKGEVIYEGKKYYVNITITPPKIKIKKTESSKFAKSSRKASGVIVN